jgi:hypothetical protein
MRRCANVSPMVVRAGRRSPQTVSVILGLPFDEDGAEALRVRGLSGGAGAGKWIEADPTGRCHQPHQPLREGDRFDGRMLGAEAVFL